MSTARHQQTTRHRTVAHPHAQGPRNEAPPRGGGRLSVATLAAASTSSVVSAVVVSHIWGPGTLYGAAATPVIVALVSDAVQRPRRALQQARQTRAFDPLAEGRRGMDEGDFLAAAATGGGDRTIHQVPAGPRVPHMPKRRSMLIALATGLIAFALAAFALTGSELVFGSSAVGGVSSRTTLFGGATHKSKSEKKSSGDSSSKHSKSKKRQRTTQQDKSTTTTTTPTAPATTTPEPTAPGTTTTAPPQTSTGSGGTSAPSPKSTQTAPGATGSESPTTTQPPSSTTPAPATP